MPQEFKNYLEENFSAKIFDNIYDAIKDVDVVMMLRIQQERMQGAYITSLGEYFRDFGLDHDKLKSAKKDVIVLHPGPINREVEISSALADDEKFSMILQQVEAGVAVRRAILKFL
jgi:aspartate carbamoyltransferase catalytic subunit